MKKEVVITSACRTPIGNFGGSFLNVSAARLGSIVISDAIKRSGIEAINIDEVFLGCVLQAGLGQNIARQSSVLAGLSFKVPSMTVNMVCGSGLKSVCLAVQSITSGDGDILVAGGTENMSQSPYLLKQTRWGTKMGNVELVDSLIYDALTDVFNQYHMGMTAENIAEKYSIPREEQDEFAVMSQNRAEKAQKENIFSDEITPVNVELNKSGFKLIDKDEFIRYGTTAEKLSTLRPVFKTNGTVTPGNASGINDGAAAFVLMSREKAHSLGIKPMAKILSYASTGVDPAIMGMGPVEACKKALDKANLTIADIGLIEVNEAFAVQTIAVYKELKIRVDRLNVNGGAIALGHPVGASGARILVTLIYEMKRRNVRYGMASLCIGGGMGIAVIVENEYAERI
jgi:acetyl-CoA C-acetyltransferase